MSDKHIVKVINAEVNGGQQVMFVSSGGDHLILQAECYGDHGTTINLSSVEGFEIAMDEMRYKVAEEDLNEEACHEYEVQIHQSLAIVIKMVVNQDGNVIVTIVEASTNEHLVSIYIASWQQFDEAFENLCKSYYNEVA